MELLGGLACWTELGGGPRPRVPIGAGRPRPRPFDGAPPTNPKPWPKVRLGWGGLGGVSLRLLPSLPLRDKEGAIILFHREQTEALNGEAPA